MTETDILEVLKEVIDPELGIGIVDLGLVYDIRIAGNEIMLDITMTTPACPLSTQIKSDIRAILLDAFPQIELLDIQLVWEPFWDPMMMSIQAREQLGWL